MKRDKLRILRHFLAEKTPALVLAASVLCLAFCLFSNSYNGAKLQNFGAIERIERKIDKRLKILDLRAEELLSEVSIEDFTSFASRIPEDMVLYLYEYDSLKIWFNRFPLDCERLPESAPYPLFRDNGFSASEEVFASIQDRYTVANLGNRTYIIYKKSNGPRTVVAALQVVEQFSATHSRISRKIYSREGMRLIPLSEDSGYEVMVRSSFDQNAPKVPMMKLSVDDSFSAGGILSTPLSAVLIFVSIVLLAISSLLYHFRFRKPESLLISLLVDVLCCGVCLYLGSRMMYSKLFSPLLYADGNVLSSLGALIAVNCGVIMASYLLLLSSGSISRQGRWRKASLLLYSALLLSLGVYVHFTIRSLLLNSSFTLTPFSFDITSVFYGFVLLTYVLLFCAMYSSGKIILSECGVKISKALLASAFALFCAAWTGIFLDRYLRQRQEGYDVIFTNMLMMQRDPSLEMQLRRLERSILHDEIVSSLSRVPGTQRILRNYLAEHYFNSIADYGFSVFTGNDSQQRIREFFSYGPDVARPIAPESNFFFVNQAKGPGNYTAIFSYLSPDKADISYLMVVVPLKPSAERAGLPPFYSFARYREGDLLECSGQYAYPTHLDGNDPLLTSQKEDFRLEGYIHHRRSYPTYDEIVILSHPKRSFLSNLLVFIYIFLTLNLVFLISEGRSAKRKNGEKRFFRTRINAVICIALLSGLIAMASVSVAFVYKRNERNLNALMADKITNMQMMLSLGAQNLEPSSYAMNHGFAAQIRRIAGSTGGVTLYSPSGRLMTSTSLFEHETKIEMNRISPDAWYNLTVRSQRYYIRKVKIDGETRYVLYAPVHNSKGELLFIASTRYNDESYFFTREAFIHAATIFSFFLLIMMLSILISSNVVASVFRPLVVLGERMTGAQQGRLEPIEYTRDDEIKAIVTAYNSMVAELEKSSRILAQSERNKAWSEMARQVAHEIKNPLTPMKLEIQRLMRIKARGDESFGEKFDRSMQVVLDHIEILSATAGEFSTFAKLYSQENTSFDLDAELKAQLLLYDSRPSIDISYLGLEDSVISGPKPQIIRVLVNLLNNAVQAVEEQGGGSILVSLRKSSQMDDAFDIVVEDSGEGVSEENLTRLFTPNFTTKSGGTGLGLAISRSIVDRCGGKIAYSRSFSLSGACFTVTLPLMCES